MFPIYRYLEESVKKMSCNMYVVLKYMFFFILYDKRLC